MMNLRDFLFAQDTIANACELIIKHVNNQIEDVEYVELEPDPDDGPAPMATLVYNPKK